MTMAKRILRSVKGTILIDIHFTRSLVNNLIAFCDSNFVVNPNDRRSGICVFRE